jgi:hypothetical protein
LGERLSLLVAGDIGGTSQNSDYSWDALGVVGYRFGGCSGTTTPTCSALDDS